MGEPATHTPFGHAGRGVLLTRAVRLASFAIAWNIVEGVVSLVAAKQAQSIALLGFGLQALIETASGIIILWRVHAERKTTDPAAVERVEERAGKLVAISLVLLAAYIGWEAAFALATGQEAKASPIGMAVTGTSILLMFYLARAKRATAHALQSRAMAADAFQTTACFYLSILVLLGITLNAAFGWWWADPAAALAMVLPLLSEAREAWQGEDVH